MKRKDYLADPHVEDFLEYLAKNLSSFKHNYFYKGKSDDDRRNRRWKCDSFGESMLPEPIDIDDTLFTGYSWPFKFPYWNDSKFESRSGRSLTDSNGVLTDLATQLQNSIGESNELACQVACQSILAWGGVLNGNQQSIFNRAGSLCSALKSVQDKLKNDDLDSDTFGKFLRDQGLKMNSGYTKIYSCLSENFIIYDGRVGSALGLLVRKFCDGRHPTVPDNLAFRWASGQSKDSKEWRNPSADGLNFFPMSKGNTTIKTSDEHAKWNLRANWLLLQLLNDKEFQALNDFCHGCDVEPLRQIEAGLFMIGYKVNPKCLDDGALSE